MRWLPFCLLYNAKDNEVSAIATTNGAVFVGDSKGYLTALNAADGEFLWTAQAVKKDTITALLA